MRIIIPKTFCEIDPTYGPVFFTGGPVRGGGDWQQKCCKIIQQHLKQFYIAIPYYHNSEEPYPLMTQAMLGKQNVFPRQVNWERFYMQQAATNGCLIFWLPEQSKTNPRPISTGPYGRDSYGELGRWSAELKYNPHYKIAFGGEEGFSGIDLIRRNLLDDLKKDYPFFDNLPDLVSFAISLATRKPQ